MKRFKSEFLADQFPVRYRHDFHLGHHFFLKINFAAAV
jgi:hypothetical protein